MKFRFLYIAVSLHFVLDIMGGIVQRNKGVILFHSNHGEVAQVESTRSKFRPASSAFENPPPSQPAQKVGRNK